MLRKILDKSLKEGEDTMPRKTRSFYDNMMAATGIPLILLWLSFACYIIYSGVNDKTGVVQDNLDFYVALIAIIGGPALLFLTAVLDAWKTEGSAEMAAIPSRIEAELVGTLAKREHTYALEVINIEHQNKMTTLAQAHDFRMEEASEGIKPKKH